MRREYACWSCNGTGVEYGDGGTGDEPAPDNCDVCERAMKFKRIAVAALYVCDACRDVGCDQLGKTHDHLIIGIAR